MSRRAKVIFLAAVLFAVLVIVSGCASINNYSENGKYNLTRKAYVMIGEELVELDIVEYIIGSSGSVHLYTSDNQRYITHLENVVIKEDRSYENN